MDLRLVLLILVFAKSQDAVVISAEDHYTRMQGVARVNNQTVEAGREAVLRCRSSSTGTSSTSIPASKLIDKNDGESKAGASNTAKRCKWEQDGTEIELSSTRHSFSYDESHVCELTIHPVLTSDAGRYVCKSDQVISEPGFLKVVNQPGQPHISQAVGGEVVEVGQGGHVQEDHQGQVELTCESLGAHPPADILWRHGDGTLVTGEMLDLVTMMEANVFRTSSTLRLLPGKEETVVCAAFNEAFPTERLSSPVKLRVRHPPSVELTFTSPSTVSVGETVELECHATAYPANLTYAWTIDGRKVEDEEGRSLKVKNVNQEADGSIVTCQVSNSMGRSWASLALSVRHGPTIVAQPQPVFARPGETATFKCEAEGNPPPRYVWIRKSTHELVGYGPNLSLPASAETEGLYMCKAFGTNSSSVTSTPASLALVKAPTVLLDSIKTASMGSDVVFNCQVAGPVSPDTTLLWLHGEEPVGEENEHIRLISSPEGLGLLLKGVTRNDLGRWGCFSSNEVGTDYKEIELTEESNNLVSLALFLNILAAISLFAVVLVCKRLRRGNVELMEKEKLKVQLEEEGRPIYKGVGDNGTLTQLLPGFHYKGPQMSASSTMVDISSLESDHSSYQYAGNRSLGSTTVTDVDMDCSVLTNLSLLSEDENSQKETPSWQES